MSEKNVKKELGTFALLMTGLGTIIGSGWLFGAWKAASVAGPAAIIAWILGMIATVFIGLTYAELGTMFPQTGGMVRYAQHSHDPFVGFLSGWANWIAIVSVIPVEAGGFRSIHELVALGIGAGAFMTGRSCPRRG